ncbi:hypothetical protein, partial [Xanthomonas translucens]|uniref:hypothetical protein n=1 Tax=Xanthomonas campestris pv. translucens TaxID=343 RepID=UPI001E54A6CC
GYFDQPAAAEERFFAQAKKNNPRQRKLLLLLQSFKIPVPGPTTAGNPHTRPLLPSPGFRVTLPTSVRQRI